MVEILSDVCVCSAADGGRRTQERCASSIRSNSSSYCLALASSIPREDNFRTPLHHIRTEHKYINELSFLVGEYCALAHVAASLGPETAPEGGVASAGCFLRAMGLPWLQCLWWRRSSSDESSPLSLELSPNARFLWKMQHSVTSLDTASETHASHHSYSEWAHCWTSCAPGARCPPHLH